MTGSGRGGDSGSTAGELWDVSGAWEPLVWGLDASERGSAASGERVECMDGAVRGDGG
jgi:hypothetical protein